MDGHDDRLRYSEIAFIVEGTCADRVVAFGAVMAPAPFELPAVRPVKIRGTCAVMMALGGVICEEFDGHYRRSYAGGLGAHDDGCSGIMEIDVLPVLWLRDGDYGGLIERERCGPQPVAGHSGKIKNVYFAVAVDVAGDNSLANRLAEIRFTRFGRPAIGAHI